MAFLEIWKENMGACVLAAVHFLLMFAFAVTYGVLSTVVSTTYLSYFFVVSISWFAIPATVTLIGMFCSNKNILLVGSWLCFALIGQAVYVVLGVISVEKLLVAADGVFAAFVLALLLTSAVFAVLGYVRRQRIMDRRYCNDYDAMTARNESQNLFQEDFPTVVVLFFLLFGWICMVVSGYIDNSGLSFGFMVSPSIVFTCSSLALYATSARDPLLCKIASGFSLYSAVLQGCWCGWMSSHANTLIMAVEMFGSLSPGTVVATQIASAVILPVGLALTCFSLLLLSLTIYLRAKRLTEEKAQPASPIGQLARWPGLVLMVVYSVAAIANFVCDTHFVERSSQGSSVLSLDAQVQLYGSTNQDHVLLFVVMALTLGTASFKSRPLALIGLWLSILPMFWTAVSLQIAYFSLQIAGSVFVLVSAVAHALMGLCLLLAFVFFLFAFFMLSPAKSQVTGETPFRISDDYLNVFILLFAALTYAIRLAGWFFLDQTVSTIASQNRIFASVVEFPLLFYTAGLVVIGASSTMSKNALLVAVPLSLTSAIFALYGVVVIELPPVQVGLQFGTTIPVSTWLFFVGQIAMCVSQFLLTGGALFRFVLVQTDHRRAEEGLAESLL